MDDMYPEDIMNEPSPARQEIERAISVLRTYWKIRPSIERIAILVQENRDFFGTRTGDDMLEGAANKLEELIEQWRA